MAQQTRYYYLLLNFECCAIYFLYSIFRRYNCIGTSNFKKGYLKMTIIFAYTSKLPTRLYCSEIAQNKKAINTTQKGVFIAFLEK